MTDIRARFKPVLASVDTDGPRGGFAHVARAARVGVAVFLRLWSQWPRWTAWVVDGVRDVRGGVVGRLAVVPVRDRH